MPKPSPLFIFFSNKIWSQFQVPLILHLTLTNYKLAGFLKGLHRTPLSPARFVNLFDGTSTNQIQLFWKLFWLRHLRRLTSKADYDFYRMKTWLTSSSLCFFSSWFHKSFFLHWFLHLCNKRRNPYHQQVLWKERGGIFWCVIYNTMPNIRNNLPNSWNDIPI